MSLKAIFQFGKCHASVAVTFIYLIILETTLSCKKSLVYIYSFANKCPKKR